MTVSFYNWYIVAVRVFFCLLFFCFKQKTEYEMRISDWSSDVCSSDLDRTLYFGRRGSGSASGLYLGNRPRRAAGKAILGARLAKAGFFPDGGRGTVGGCVSRRARPPNQWCTNRPSAFGRGRQPHRPVGGATRPHDLLDDAALRGKHRAGPP